MLGEEKEHAVLVLKLPGVNGENWLDVQLLLKESGHGLGWRRPHLSRAWRDLETPHIAVQQEFGKAESLLIAEIQLHPESRFYPLAWQEQIVFAQIGDVVEFLTLLIADVPTYATML
jgi:hypothetical protein